MKKLFIALLVLCMLGAGVLYWLMQAVPAPNPLAPHGEPKSESEVPAGEVGHGEPGEEGHEGAEGEEKPAGEGHEKASEHGEEAPAKSEAHGKADAHGKEGRKEAKEDKHALVVLEIATEPVNAEVYVDGALSGTTPTDFKLEPTAREIVLKAEGFEEYKREAPSSADATGPITWKIQLKPLKGQLKAPPHKKGKAEAKPTKKGLFNEKKPEVTEVEPAEAVEAVKQEASDDLTLHGSLKGFYLQLESLAADVSEAQVAAKVQAHRATSGATVHACRVDLMAKGKWTRLLAGPYETKGKAAQALTALQNKIPEESFVTGGQPCL